MGQAKSAKDYTVVQRYVPEQWRRVADHGAYWLCQNTKKSERYCMYCLPSSILQQIDQLQKYEFRKLNSSWLIKVQALLSIHEAFICNEPSSVYLVTEMILYLLDQVAEISFEDGLLVLWNAAAGYNVMSYFYGPIEPEEYLIGFNEKGVPKIWINQNFSKNQPSYGLSIELMKCNPLALKRKNIECVQKLFSLVENKVKFGYPPEFKNKSSEISSYLEAISFLSEYCEENGIGIPDTVQSVIMKTEQQRKNRQSTKRNNSHDAIRQEELGNTSKLRFTQKEVSLAKALSPNLQQTRALLTGNQTSVPKVIIQNRVSAIKSQNPLVIYRRQESFLSTPKFIKKDSHPQPLIKVINQPPHIKPIYDKTETVKKTGQKKIVYISPSFDLKSSEKLRSSQAVIENQKLSQSNKFPSPKEISHCQNIVKKQFPEQNFIQLQKKSLEKVGDEENSMTIQKQEIVEEKAVPIEAIFYPEQQEGGNHQEIIKIIEPIAQQMNEQMIEEAIIPDAEEINSSNAKNAECTIQDEKKEEEKVNQQIQKKEQASEMNPENEDKKKPSQSEIEEYISVKFQDHLKQRESENIEEQKKEEKDNLPIFQTFKKETEHEGENDELLDVSELDRKLAALQSLNSSIGMTSKQPTDNFSMTNIQYSQYQRYSPFKDYKESYKRYGHPKSLQQSLSIKRSKLDEIDKKYQKYVLDKKNQSYQGYSRKANNSYQGYSAGTSDVDIFLNNQQRMKQIKPETQKRQKIERNPLIKGKLTYQKLREYIWK